MDSCRIRSVVSCSSDLILSLAWRCRDRKLLSSVRIWLGEAPRRRAASNAFAASVTAWRTAATDVAWRTARWAALTAWFAEVISMRKGGATGAEYGTRCPDVWAVLVTAWRALRALG